MHGDKVYKTYDYQNRVVSRVAASLFSFTALLFSAATSVDQEAPAPVTAILQAC